MVSGRAKVRYGMTRPGIVLYRPTSRHSLKIGAAIAICGNVEIDSTTARIRNLRFILSRASAYAQNEPTMSDSAVVTRATIALFFSAIVKFESLKIAS